MQALQLPIITGCGRLVAHLHEQLQGGTAVDFTNDQMQWFRNHDRNGNTGETESAAGKVGAVLDYAQIGNTVKVVQECVCSQTRDSKV